MLYELRIKLTSEMLGEQQTHQKIRRFNRPKNLNGNILLDIPYWSWAISEACEALSFRDVDGSRIMMDRSLRSPSLQIHVRHWMQTNGRTGKKTRKEEKFESIPVGAELSFKLIVSEKPDPSKRADGERSPTEDELFKIFETLGQLIGVSPWGSRFGYGRFDVMHVRAV